MFPIAYNLSLLSQDQQSADGWASSWASVKRASVERDNVKRANVKTHPSVTIYQILYIDLILYKDHE